MLLHSGRAGCRLPGCVEEQQVPALSAGGQGLPGGLEGREIVEIGLEFVRNGFGGRGAMRLEPGLLHLDGFANQSSKSGFLSSEMCSRVFSTYALRSGRYRAQSFAASSTSGQRCTLHSGVPPIEQRPQPSARYRSIAGFSIDMGFRASLLSSQGHYLKGTPTGRPSSAAPSALSQVLGPSCLRADGRPRRLLAAR